MSEKLENYRKKRDFAKTEEPSGKDVGGKKRDSLKFAVQYHIASRKHYDFRLEWEGVLLSWAVPKGPSFNPREKRLAVMVEDHPLDYADFEGTIPKGQYGGGTVMLWDEGSYEPAEGEDFRRGLQEGSLKFTLCGKRLKGSWALVRLKEQDGKDDKNWLLIKENDAYARGDDNIAQFNTSVKSGRTMEEITAGKDLSIRHNPFDSMSVQLAAPAADVPNKGEWLYEIKYDGYRIAAFAQGGQVRLITRTGKDYTDKFAKIAAAVRSVSKGRAMVLDGEIIVQGEDGKPDFQALQSYVKSPDKKNIVYAVFDLTALDGEDLRSKPLIERKERLAQLLQDAPPNVLYSKHSIGAGKELFAAAAKMGLEGIVGKLAHSPYLGERNGDWIKLKCYKQQEFVIGGYTQTDKKEKGISSLLLGCYEKGDLIYVGRAGTGLNARTAQRLQTQLTRLQRKTPPFAAPPAVKGTEHVFWARPELIAQVQFAELTKEKLLRQASFKGLREDKKPEEVVMETATDFSAQDISHESLPIDLQSSAAKKGKQTMTKKSKQRAGKGGKSTAKTAVGKSAQTSAPRTKNADAKAEKKADIKASDKAGAAKSSKPNEAQTSAPRTKNADVPVVAGVKISSPDKLIFLFPEVKKLDVVNYYERVSERMLPYAGNRILSVVRCHKGVNEACFFKKHPNTQSKGVKIISVQSSDGESGDYFYIDKKEGLIAEAQNGTLEFHIWGSRADSVEKPDMMVFDLDPDEGMDGAGVRQGVRDLKSVLDALGLSSFLKTSGGKGYHVVVPFRPTAGWEEFHDFARKVAQLMEAKWQNRYTSNIRKSSRKGKIFIDWVRNGRGATSIAPYSLRARFGAKVSMPISFDELDSVAPDGIDMFDALQRLSRPDPWKDFFKTEQELKF